jgi:Cytochrome c3
MRFTPGNWPLVLSKRKSTERTATHDRGWLIGSMVIDTLLAALLLLRVVSAGEVETCRVCHPAEAKSHSQTAHAHSLQPALISAFAEHLPPVPIGEARGGFLLFYRRTPQGLAVRTENGQNSSKGEMLWVFGAGKQGQTPLIQEGARFLEHRISFYTDRNRFDLTMGHRRGVSPTAQDALGRLLSQNEMLQCLSCHATEIGSDLEPRVPGVQCARCHPGAAEHAAGKGLPMNPGKLSSLQQVTFCGTCHRLKVPDENKTDPMNVRFQPLRLVQSKCFRSGRLSCTLCHPAHQDARRNDVGFYDAKCLSCHTRTGFHGDQRASGSCISCHMPRSSPQPHSVFTDHFIHIGRIR